jgi:membrane protein YdbS with pleckstrin-like domain
MDDEEFPDKRKNERLILIGKKHWYLMVGPFFKVFLGLVLVFIVARFLGFSIYFTIAFFLWAGIGLTYFIITYMIWAKSKYYVTNQRIIRQEQISIFAQRVTEIDFRNVHTATFEVKGPTAAAFGFGNVVLQSYGAPEAIVLKDVAHAKEIQKKISEIISEMNQEEREFEDIEKAILIRKKPAKADESEKNSGPTKYIPRKPHIENDDE